MSEAGSRRAGLPGALGLSGRTAPRAGAGGRDLRSRRRLALAVPVVLSLTALLGFLPTAASAS
ncbi:hypothetical protein ACWDZX_35615, partial [Streptomyces collinus]